MLIVDVFAERPLEGNQLAVFPDAAAYSDEFMQSLALEMNFSETTFISGQADDGSWRVRIFTPATELPFAGHPTLGTAWVIRNLLSVESPDEVTLNLKVGKVQVTFEENGNPEDAIPWLTAPEIKLGKLVDPNAVASALRLDPDQLDPASPVQLVDVGLTSAMVPVRSLEALKRVRPDMDALRAAGVPGQAYIFCRQTNDPALQVAARFFFEAGGPREDPATGSATASFGGYALEHGLFGERFSVRIEQGRQMGRPSLLRLEGSRVEGRPLIQVGGRVMPVSKGALFASVRDPRPVVI